MYYCVKVPLKSLNFDETLYLANRYINLSHIQTFF